MALPHSQKIVKLKDLYLHRLPRATKRAFLECIELPLFSKFPWYLAGGTALALQEGHRQSVDLDFFTVRSGFAELSTERQLLKTSSWVTSLRQEGTLYGTFYKAKMSFIAYPFFLPSKEKILCGELSMLLSGDIAVMKIVAISQRGRKRDFVDLFWYARQKEPLGEIIKRTVEKYPGQERNLNHILRSLIYFDDAEDDPMPKLFFKATWKQIKDYFITETVRAAGSLLGLK